MKEESNIRKNLRMEIRCNSKYLREKNVNYVESKPYYTR